MDVYRRRRIGAVLIIAVIAAAIWAVWPKSSPAPATTGEGARPSAASTLLEVSRQDVAAAAIWVTDNGSGEGYEPKPGGSVRMASASVGGVVLFTRTSAGVCITYAVVGAQPTDPVVDPTGAGCSDATWADKVASLSAAMPSPPGP